MTWKSPNGQLLYRVGDVMISTNSDNPSTFFGGTWQLLCPGRTLVCVDTNDSDFNTVKKTGGSKYIQRHKHSVICAGAGAHNHKSNGGYPFLTDLGAGTQLPTARGNDYGFRADVNHVTSVGNHTHSIEVYNTGSGDSQNLQPFMAVYIWVRIA